MEFNEASEEILLNFMKDSSGKLFPVYLVDWHKQLSSIVATL